MKRWMVLLAACLLAAFSVQAAEVAGVRIDDRTRVGNTELVLNGAGLRTKFFFKVYAAALYAPRKTARAEELLESAEPRRVTLHLLRDLEAETLVKALDEGLRANLGPAEQTALKADIDRFAALMRSIGNARKGDVITIDFGADGTAVGMNGSARGSVPGAAFGRALLRVWIGEHPAQADLKQALLGG